MLYLVPRPDLAVPTWQWARASGDTVTAQGESSTQELPADESICLIVPARRMSWHRLTIPKIGAPRLQAALNGLLEDRLLDPPEELHFALEPAFKPGQPHPQWVAACDRQTLQHSLNHLQDAGRNVVRILPEIVPTASVCVLAHEQDQEPWLSVSGPSGVWSQPLPREGSVHDLRSWLGSSAPLECRSTPACAALVEQHFSDWSWAIETPASQWLRSSSTAWNLAQFDMRLSAQNRRNASLRQWGRQLISDPAWSSTRWGMGALLTVQIVGLNLVAWQERREIHYLEESIQQLLVKTAPDTRLVLDAPRQMEQALLQARAGNGTPSGSDPESLLQALDRGMSGMPVRLVRLEYNPNRTVVGLSGSGVALAERINQRLSGSGWKAQSQGNDLLMTWSAP